jgi:hypothetical protein
MLMFEIYREELVDYFVGIGVRIGVDGEKDREVDSEEAEGCGGEHGGRVLKSERCDMVRVCDVLAEVENVVREEVGGLLSNLGWVLVKGFAR